MNRRGYDAALAVALAISILLFLVPQVFFVQQSLYQNLGMGMVGDRLTLVNYRTILGDSFYLAVFGRTLVLSASAAVIGLIIAYPTAYWLARLRARTARALIVLLLVSSFVSIVVKVLGLTLILGAQGPFSAALRLLGAERFAASLLNSNLSVAIGLVQYSLPILVLLLFGVIQTIPRSLEEAASVCGAGDWRLLVRVLLPLTSQGLVTAGLIAFNMNMGAFTSAVLLGGGKVLTVPVLIQQKIVLEVDYPTAAALAVLLTVGVVLINLLVIGLRHRPHLARMRPA
jgi:putative spermidine/putrescine transport system permease protein